MSTPPNQPGDTDAPEANKPIEKQLDELLVKIEEVEPGTLDPEVLPGSFVPPTEAVQAKPPAAGAEAEIDALLNAPPAVDAAPASPAQAAAEPAEPPADEKTPEQEQMLAALNSALQGLGDDEPAEAPQEAPAEVAIEPPAETATPAEDLSMEDRLQQEIAALMNAEPQVAETPAPAEEPAEAPATASPSTEDQIAMEIEGLLNTGPADPTPDTADDAAIDELDKMLAQEIDSDDELAGEFHSVEDVTAGIQVQDVAELTDDDHAATARDVAAELDSQPEDLPTPPGEPVGAAADLGDDDPFAVLSQIAETAEHNEQEHQRREAMKGPNWQHWLTTARAHLLSACYAINWPARRFLTAEWRANLGYIAILNLFFGVGFWIVRFVF